MGKLDIGYQVTLSLVAEMIWDDAIVKYKQQSLYNEIDRALAIGDEKSFLELTKQLNALTEPCD